MWDSYYIECVYLSSGSVGGTYVKGKGGSGHIGPLCAWPVSRVSRENRLTEATLQTSPAAGAATATPELLICDSGMYDRDVK